MVTLKITVSSKAMAQRLVDEFAARTDIQSVRMVVRDDSSLTPTPPKGCLAGMIQMSEASLVKDWNSPEDDYWDNVYTEFCTKKGRQQAG